MTPMDLLLYLLAATTGLLPLVLVIALMVNTVKVSIMREAERIHRYGVTETGAPAREQR